jgi:hypothetical protein
MSFKQDTNFDFDEMDFLQIEYENCLSFLFLIPTLERNTHKEPSNIKKSTVLQ